MASRKTKGAILGAAACAAAAAFIAPWEGFAAKPYRDIVGKVTWCYGETEGTPKQTYTKQECQALLMARIPDYYAPISACWGTEVEVLLRDNQRVAFVSGAYNFGAGAFCKSSMVARLKDGDIRGACEALMLYTRAGGRVVKGLVNRRVAERKLCLEGL